MKRVWMTGRLVLDPHSGATGMLALALAVAGYVLVAVRAPVGLAVAGGLLQVVAELWLGRDLSMWRQTAARDPLTGLFHRRYLEQRLGEAVATRRRRGGTVALVLLDVRCPCAPLPTTRTKRCEDEIVAICRDVRREVYEEKYGHQAP